MNDIANIEVHPFEPFIPDGAKYLIIGSFPGKEQTQHKLSDDAWLYGAKRNMFWKILEQVYNISLPDKISKQNLFRKTKTAIADIILKAVRKESTNSDSNLHIIEYNQKAIELILQQNHIVTIYFTSRFVEKLFKKLFPGINNTIVLPSPSPRYARMSFKEKVMLYKKLLPVIE